MDRKDNIQVFVRKFGKFDGSNLIFGIKMNNGNNCRSVYIRLLIFLCRYNPYIIIDKEIRDFFQIIKYVIIMYRLTVEGQF